MNSISLGRTVVPTRSFIGGEWKETEATYTVTSPVDGRTLAEVADCGEREASEAIDQAFSAFQTWKKSTAYERAQLLRRWYDLIIEHREDLAITIVGEMGKPLREARGEIQYAAGFVEWYAEEAKRIYGETVPSQFPHKRILVLKRPVGPVFGITPWNFPAAMVTRKVAPALAAGCTFILKPPEQAPLTALCLAKLWEEAGGPPGTYQVIPTTRPADLSKRVIADVRVRKLTFTGSTAVGKLLNELASKTLKRVSMELGGHAPFIIFPDADIQRAVDAAMLAKFRNVGQSCIAANRVYVHESIKQDFVEAYAEKVRKMKVGNPFSEETDIGPLVDTQALEKVKNHVRDAVARGARIVVGGQSEGLTYFPTVLTNVPPDALILQEETFGPVAPILTFSSEEEVIELANSAPFGLAAYIWTRDVGRVYRLSESLEYGIVGVNDGVPSTPQAPFGGVKDSGLGREGGKWGLEEYLETVFISIALPPA